MSPKSEATNTEAGAPVAAPMHVNGSAPPFAPRHTHGMPGQSVANGVRGQYPSEDTPPSSPELKEQKTNPRRGATALPRSRGTGFEEWFCDPPMTPVEAEEEKEDIYHPRRPFVDRIEECIQRYRARRRLDNERANLFNKYLLLGGVDSGPRQFQGLGGFDTAGLDGEEKRRLAAVDTIYGGSGSVMDRFYSAGSEHWSVDFAGVVAGFLSSMVPQLCFYEDRTIGRAVSLIENFLKYVLHHDVCPEYDDQVREALRLCDLARTELPLSYECVRSFPGEFNWAATRFFCNGNPDPQSRDRPAAAIPGWFEPREGLDPDRVLRAGVLLLGSEEQCKRLVETGPQKIRVVSTSIVHLEVAEIRRPTAEVAKLFGCIRASTPEHDREVWCRPMGTAVLRPCRIEDGWDYTDLWNSPSYPKADETYILDDALLARMRPGFKLVAKVQELSIGLRFIEEVNRVLVSFYEFLPQELMMDFREPEPSTRPPPSVDNPDASEDDDYGADA